MSTAPDNELLRDVEPPSKPPRLPAATAVVAQIRITSLLLARYPSLGRETDVPGVRVFPTARYPYLRLS